MEKQAYQTTYENEKSYWWYRARADIIEHILARRISSRDMQILNVGCGTGLISQRLSRFGFPAGIDLSSEALAFCARNQLDLLTQADGVYLPFRDQSFDACLALDVLEHIENDALALAEMARVVRPDGIVIITVPAFKWMWSKMDDLGHLRRYSIEEFKELLGQAGLSPALLTYYNFFLFPLAVLQRLMERISRRDVTSENFIPSLPRIVNELFYLIFKWERTWIEHIRFPFGLSILALAKKNPAS
jgi:SAM-dependent methyltransferase